VLSKLIEREALQNDLLRRGYIVSAADVRQRWRRMRKEGRLGRFPARRDPSSVLLDVRIQLMRETVHDGIRKASIRRAYSAGPDREVTWFEQQFPIRWRKATICVARLKVPACGAVAGRSAA
jgi:hypothetical protein